ncbi:MAG: B12-binding domain-containing radical SAM protein, partial [Planctomycetes bacterium]|nr:B12-binding domain-containing radical SAM protein [Planctomycetota bacterium]
MANTQVRILEDDVERRFLPFVRRPARYIGGEVNQVKKDLAGCDVKVALCFPDVYEIGMSNTGLAVIYEVLNRLDGVATERVFAPWADGEEIMRRESIPLFTLESRAAAADFDIIGFGLTNEMCYPNMLNMLDLAGVALRSEDRSDD